MFKSTGRKHFDVCQNKQFTEIRSNGVENRIRSLELTCLRAKTLGTPVVARAVEHYDSVNVSDDHSLDNKSKRTAVYNNLSIAITSLASTAASAVCETCPFYSMDPEEANRLQTSYNDAETARLESEQRLREVTARVAEQQ